MAWAALTGRRGAPDVPHPATAAPPPLPGGDVLTSLVDTMDDALVVVDSHLNVVHWNAAMERLTGLARAGARGRNLRRLVPMLDAIAFPQYLRRALSSESTFTAQVAPDAWVEARCVPLRDAVGRVTGAAGFLTDMTERIRRAVFVRALEAIGRSLTSSLDLNEVLDTIVDKALEVMGADSALVVSWDGQAPEFRVMRAAGRLSDRYTAAGTIPVGGGPISRVVLESRPIATPNILQDPQLWVTPERRAQIEREGFRAVAAAPLASKGRVHGALVVHYWAERTVDKDELMALTRLAEQAALAIDNARLYADATRRAERLRELAEVERLVAASLDLDDVLRRIAEATARLVEAPVVHLWTAEPGARLLRLRAWSVQANLPDVQMPATLAFGEGITGAAAERGEPVFVPDAGQDPRVRLLGWWREAGLGTILAVPLLSGETLLGVLTVRARSGALAAAEDQALITSLAGRAALAMQNARAYAEAVRRAARLRDLATVTQSITSSLDTSDVMQRIVEAAAGMRPGALAAVHVFDLQRETLRFAAYSSPELRAFPDEFPAAAGLPGLVFTQRRPVLIPDPLDHPRTLAPEWWRQRAGASYYGLPIIVGETFVGILDYILPEGSPDGEEQEALRLLAASAGIAIRNASLYQAERMQAERVGALAAINQRISSALDLDELLRMIAESAASLTGVKHALFWLADDERRTLAVKAGSTPGLAEDFPQPVVGYELGGVGWVARHRAPLVIDDVLGDEPRDDHAWWRRWGISAFAGYPIIAGDELRAALVLCHSEPIRFTEETRQVVDMFIAQATLAFENARLYASARDSLARLKETQAQLVQAAKMSALGQLVSGVAHELNNPLSVIIGYGQLLLNRAAPEVLRRPVELMVEQGDRMGKIVKNLLYFARQRPPERAPVDLNQVIDQALALRLNQLTLSGIAVEREFAGGLPPVLADAQQLQQVFLNLLLNAEQALAPNGGGRIVFRTSVVQGGRTVRADVVDNGPGIPADILPRVFEPFFTTKEVGVGTGLGLSVSYGIAEEHGGRLSVESEPGDTAFALELPVGTPVAAARAPGAPARSAFFGDGRVALVVDDEAGVVDLVVTVLRETGWRVDVAPGGRLGLERVRQRRYDLVVSDMRMPDGGGEEFYRSAIMADQALGGRFLFITGDTANVQAWAFLKRARLPVLEKPFTPDVFLEAVRRVAGSLTASGLRA
ncbi:MAG TPA: GAF domain-containing protein [Methylomirabilota bacterium]|nr:GAF domain-containing protein [Methylomirabilota bacterium]